MNMELTLPAAFLVGLLGGVHCAGMCSGIVGALTGSLAPAIRESKSSFLLALFAYNSGRIASYTVAGLLLGLLGQQVSAFGVLATWPVGRILAGVFMILFGLYLAGWWQVLRVLEKAGSRVWKHIEPFGRRFIPVQGAAQACMLGAIWGWLPCGMVYAVLAMALASSSVLYGGLIMLCFGLGTLPLMVAMGYTFGALTRILQAPAMRAVAGVTVILFGLYTIVVGPAGHDHHRQQDAQDHVHHLHHPGPANQP